MTQSWISKYKYLFLILLLSFALRAWGITFGFPFFLHPDETKIVEPALTIAFNIKTADFNPHFFYYPHFLMYLLVLVVQFIKVVLLPFSGVFNSLPKESFYFIARLITALFGTASVFLTYLIAKKIAPKGREEMVGLMSALFLSTAFLHVRNSHYYTGDVPATFFILLSLYFFLCAVIPAKAGIQHFFSSVSHSGLSRISFCILAGLFCGIGISTKYYPALLLLIYIPVLIFLFRKNLKSLLLYCFIVLTTSAIGFLMFTPYAFLDSKHFLETMRESNLRSSSGFMGATSNNPFYYIFNNDLSIDESFSGNSLAEGVGWGMLIFSGFGFCVAATHASPIRIWKKLAGRAPQLQNTVIIIALTFLYFLFFSRYPTKLVRWLVCIVPFLSILSAVVIVVATSYVASWFSGLLNWRNRIAQLQGKTDSGLCQNDRRVCRDAKFCVSTFGLATIVAVVFLPNLSKSLRFDYALSRGDTRVQAYDYILSNIPKQTPIIFESILIHRMVEDGDYKLFQITHDRYNTKGEIDNDLPPDLDKLLAESKAQYIIINGWARQKYFNPSSAVYFPQVSESWRDFYNEIDKRFEKVKVFDPQKDLLSGPTVAIYKPYPLPR